jgi:molybdopterin converting factor small subunit
MGVIINLHKTHRPYTDGVEQVEVEGETVGECLNRLVERHPLMRDQLFEADGRLRKTIEIYLNMAGAYPDELKRPTASGDQIHVTLMLAGG